MTPPPRLATIDLGTNTVRLLVADVDPSGGWRVLEQDQQVTRVGEGLASTGRLGDAAMARTLDVLLDYTARARRAGAGLTRIVATSAVREAANGAEFGAAVRSRTGVDLDVVSGEREARLTILGIMRGFGLTTGRLLAFDIGGGSTEFTLAEGGDVLAAVSLRLGVVPLAERYPFAGPVEPDRYARLADEVRRRLERELPGAIVRAGVPSLVGTAGTVTTLAALDLGLASYDATRVHGHRLPRPAIERQRARLAALAVHERAALPCLEPGRADLIVPGTAIVLAALDVLGLDEVVVSDWGLREGIMAEAAGTVI
jgi:exopolyphosphatase/guanosine-5'-triphosphate,3'-diphosphate pyrophosphatase